MCSPHAQQHHRKTPLLLATAVDSITVTIGIMRTGQDQPWIPADLYNLLMAASVVITIAALQTILRPQLPEPTHPEAPTNQDVYWRGYLMGHNSNQGRGE